MKKREKKKASMGLKIAARFLWILTLAATVFFGYELYKLNMIPLNYYLIGMGVLFFIVFIIGVFALRKKAGRTSLSIISFISVIIIAVLGFGSLKIKDTVSFMEKNLGIKFETNVYYVLVNADSEYEKIKDIKGETVYTYKDLDDMEPVEKALTKKVKVEFEYAKSVYEMLII